jgi:hypothetical protein
LRESWARWRSPGGAGFDDRTSGPSALVAACGVRGEVKLAGEESR